MSSEYAKTVQGASLILGSFKPGTSNTIGHENPDDSVGNAENGNNDEADSSTRLAALIEAGVLYSRAKMHGFVQEKPERGGVESASDSTAAADKWVAPHVSYERLDESFKVPDGDVPSIANAALGEGAAWLSQLMIRRVRHSAEEIPGQSVKYWSSFGDRIFLRRDDQSSRSKRGQSTEGFATKSAEVAETGAVPISDAPGKTRPMENVPRSPSEAADENAFSEAASTVPIVSDAPATQEPRIEDQLRDLTIEGSGGEKSVRDDVNQQNQDEPKLDSISAQADVEDDQITNQGVDKQGRGDCETITVFYGPNEDTIRLENFAEFLWNDGPSTLCAVCDGDFLDEKGPPIRTMSMAPCQAILPGFFDYPELAVRIHNRHLCCIEERRIPIVPVSHVWHEGVARANIEQQLNDIAIYEIFFQPLYVLKLATYRFIEILGHVEIWHDYFSIPQFQRNLQQRLLLTLPYIYRVAPWCLVHLDDVPSTMIRDMFPCLGNNTVRSHIHRVSCIVGFSAAKWFQRMWVNLEYAFSQRACVLTSDGCVLFWDGHELTRDSLTLFLEHAMVEKREIDVQLSMQMSADSYEQYKSMIPMNSVPLSARSRQIPGQALTYGEAIEAISRLDCREYRDRFIALVGMLSLGSYKDATIQIPDDPIEACLWVARKCLQRGDHTPLILTPCGNEKEVDGARWLVGHENMSPTMCYFGRRTSPPKNPNILTGDQVKFEMQFVGEITKITRVDFREGDELQNFDSVAEIVLSTVRGDLRAFVDAILRIYCVPLYMVDPEIPNSFAEYESLDAQFVENLKKMLEYYRKDVDMDDDDERLFTCSYMVEQLRLTRPYRSNLPTARGPFTRLMYAGSFSAAQFYVDTIAVVKCPGCERSFVFRIYLYKDKLPNAQLFRIQGLGYEGSIPNGVGLVISEGKIVGKMVYGTPACECEVLQTVEIE